MRTFLISSRGRIVARALSVEALGAMIRLLGDVVDVQEVRPSLGYYPSDMTQFHAGQEFGL